MRTAEAIRTKNAQLFATTQIPKLLITSMRNMSLHFLREKNTNMSSIDVLYIQFAWQHHFIIIKKELQE